jgi:uncharacterized protein (TIGR02001 family)
MRLSSIIALALFSASLTPIAYAEEAPATPAVAEPTSPWSLTGNVSFVSDYYARGFSQSWHKPAIQGGMDISHESGFYAGVWGSSISPQTYVDSTTEIDVYAGYNGKIGSVEGLGWTAGLIGYLYPGGNWNKCPTCTLSDGTTPVTADKRFDTFEANFGVSYLWLSAKASVTLTDWFGANKNTGFEDGSKGSTYFEINANYPLPFYDLTLIGHVGRLNVATRVTPGAYGTFSSGKGNPDYTDYKVGLSKTLPFANKGITLGVYYVGADDTGYWSSRGFGGSSFNGGSGAKDLTDNRYVVTLGTTF